MYFNKKLGLIVLLLVFIFPQQSFAGWVERSSAGSRAWYSVASSLDGVKLAAVVYGGYIYTSTDSGATWKERTGAGSHAWRSIASSYDGTNLVVVDGNPGYIYTSSDSGATWVERTSAGSRNWMSIATSEDGLKLVAVSNMGNYIYTSSDGGISWEKRTNSGSRNWNSVASSSNGSKLIASTNSGYIFTSTDGGDTWIERTGCRASMVASSSDGIKLVAFSGSNIGGSIYTSIDSGATWIERTNAGLKDWSSISSSLDGTKLVASAKNNYVYTSTDSGVTWTAQTNIGIRGWQAVASSSDGTKLIAGNLIVNPNRYIYTYDPTTVAPTVVTNPASSLSGNATTLNGTISDTGGDIITIRGFEYGTDINYGTSVVFNGEFNAEAFSGFTTPPTCGGNTYHYRAYATNSAGTSYGQDQSFTTTACNLATWTQQASAPAVFLSSIVSSSDGMKLAALGRADYFAQNKYIYTSTDGGNTWTRRDSAGFLGWTSVASSSDGTKLVAAAGSLTRSYIYTSSDGGDTWIQRTSSGLRRWFSVASSFDGTKLVAAENSTDQGYIYVSINSGVDWTTTNTPNISWYFVASSSDGNKLIASTDGEGTYTSSNSGTTWTQSTTRSGNVSSSSSGDKLVIAVGNGYIYTSSNSGTTWIERTGSSSRKWNSIKYSSDGSKIIASDKPLYDGTSGSVYVSSDDGLSWVMQDAIGSNGFGSVALSSDGSRLIAASSSSPYPLYTYGAIVDATTPTTTDNTDSTVYNGSVVVTLTCNDGSGSGCQKTYYTTDGSTPTNGSTSGTSMILSNEGTYTIKYFSVDNSNNSEVVKTASNTVVIDKTAATISSVSSGTPSTSGATITWTTNELSSSQVDYGLTSNYGLITSETDTGTRVTSHSVTLSGLSSCTTYYYGAHSKDSATNEAISSGYNFTTSGCTANASVVNNSSEKMAIEAGGTLLIKDDNLNGLKLDVPVSFAESDATFQAHQLDKNTVIDSISTPTDYLATNGYIYELKALTDDSTTISTFDNPLTVTLNYSTDDISGLDESSLKIYSWNETSWNELSNCSVVKAVNTITCSTSHFSTFGLFGKAPVRRSHGGSFLSLNSKQKEITPAITPTILCPNGNTLVSNCKILPTETQTILPVINNIKTIVPTKTIISISIVGKNIIPNTKSTEVKLLQNLLKDLGYLKAIPTGFYGSATLLAVKKYQKDHKIPQTGTVGPLTRKSLSLEGKNL